MKLSRTSLVLAALILAGAGCRDDPGAAQPSRDGGADARGPLRDDLAKRQAKVDEITKEIERLRAQLGSAPDPAERDALRKRIAELHAEAASSAPDAGRVLGRMLQCRPGDTPCSDL
jgi:hypothetical protein